MSSESTEIKRYTLPLVVLEWGIFATCLTLFVMGLFHPLTVLITGGAAIVSVALYKGWIGQ